MVGACGKGAKPYYKVGKWVFNPFLCVPRPKEGNSRGIKGEIGKIKGKDGTSWGFWENLGG